MKRARLKDPAKLIELGARLAAAKATLSPVVDAAFVRAEPELRHEAKPGQVTDDKAQRLIRIATMPAIRDHVSDLPWIGWSALRELSKLGESALRVAFERGTIHRNSTRADVDDLGSTQKRAHVAERHRGDFERRRARRS